MGRTEPARLWAHTTTEESYSSGPDTIKRRTSAEPIRLPKRSALSPHHHAHRQRSPTTEAGAFRGCAFAQSGSNGLISVVTPAVTPTATPLPARPTHETGQILTPKVLPVDPLDPRNERSVSGCRCGWLGNSPGVPGASASSVAEALRHEDLHLLLAVVFLAGEKDVRFGCLLARTQPRPALLSECRSPLPTPA